MYLCHCVCVFVPILPFPLPVFSPFSSPLFVLSFREYKKKNCKTDTYKSLFFNLIPQSFFSFFLLVCFAQVVFFNRGIICSFFLSFFSLLLQSNSVRRHTILIKATTTTHNQICLRFSYQIYLLLRNIFVASQTRTCSL